MSQESLAEALITQLGDRRAYLGTGEEHEPVKTAVNDAAHAFRMVAGQHRLT